MKHRRFISMLAVGALCLSLLPTVAFAAESMDNFKTEREYPAGQFTDVAANSWLHPDPGLPPVQHLLRRQYRLHRRQPLVPALCGLRH